MHLDVPILEDPLAFVFPDDHFFDTEYHLTAAAGAKRTRTLAASLLQARDAERQANLGAEPKWR